MTVLQLFSTVVGRFAIGVVIAASALLGGCAAGGPERFGHGPFAHVRVSRPQGSPDALVLLLSGRQGSSAAAARRLAATLSEQGALVAIVDSSALLRDHFGGHGCSRLAFDLDELGHYIQAAYRLPGYRPPILAGTGVGALLAYAALAQTDDDTFAGALSVDLDPGMVAAQSCTGDTFTARHSVSGPVLQTAPKLPQPWYVQQADAAATAAVRPFVMRVGRSRLLAPAGPDARGNPALVRAFRALKQRQQAAATAPLPHRVSDLPLVEIPARAGTQSSVLAIMLSGDGGWAGLDKGVGRALAADGIPVVGYDSLRYYWKQRTPAGAAHDLARVIDYYTAHWHKQKVLLVGYSRGADVMPFLLNRLPPSARARVERVDLLGLAANITFKFELAAWFGLGSPGLPVAPQVARLPPGLAVCLYGRNDADSICDQLDPHRVAAIALPGGHHFDGAYRRLAQLIRGTLPDSPGRPASLNTTNYPWQGTGACRDPAIARLAVSDSHRPQGHDLTHCGG